MKIAYLRVSTVEQNLDRQYEAMKNYDIERYYVEKISGKNTDRPKFQEMMDFARAGDVIYVHDFSRLARSTEDLLRIVRELQEKNIGLISLKENLDTSTPTGKLMLTVIAGISEFERANMLERQREGIAIAKREGKYKGGQVKKIDNKLLNELYRQYQAREITKTQMAEKLNISRPTLYRLLKERLPVEKPVDQ